MKLGTRDLVTLAVFGALWGLVETSLGTLLKSLHLPMSGLVLSGVALFIALTARVIVPRRGSTLFIAAIALLLKLFSVGSVVVGPLVGILSEALVVELVLSFGGRPRRPLFLLAGALGVLWVLVQPFITNPLFFGRTVLDAWASLLKQGVGVLGVDMSAVVVIVTALVALHVAVGLLAGWLGWGVGNALAARLGRAPVGRRAAPTAGSAR